MVATLCPAVTSSPSSTVSVASRPGYFAATSTCVASRRPLVFTIPSGMSRPRRRLMRVSTAVRAFLSGFCCFDCATALAITRLSPEMTGAQASINAAAQTRAGPRTRAVNGRIGIGLAPLSCAERMQRRHLDLSAIPRTRPTVIPIALWCVCRRLRLLQPVSSRWLETRRAAFLNLRGQDAQHVAAGNNAGDAAISDDRHALDPVSDEHTRYLVELGILAHGDNRR